MRYRATEDEIVNLPSMAPVERLNYFLTRTVEAEEIWSLGNTNGWELQERDGRTVVHVWPYVELARLNLPPDSASASPQATSLEHFFQNILPIMIEQEIFLDIISMPEAPGRLIAASDLYTMLESMLESHEYYFDS